MTQLLTLPLNRRGFAIPAIGLFMSYAVFGQTWLTAAQIASQMTIGWNIGNSLEVPDG